MIICCDWGTSNLRVRLVDLKSHATVSEVRTAEGISGVFDSWKAQHEIGRVAFFCNILSKRVGELSKKGNLDLTGIPVIISGMASSSVGIEELPYARVPFPADGSHAITKILNDIEGMHFPVILISGVRSDDDVMRGEETQLAGLMRLNDQNDISKENVVFVFPGTHSKHIYVQNKMVTGFRTFMTGEIFQILSKHSILKASLGPAPTFCTGQSDLASFKRGILKSKDTSLLQALFTVRTNELFNKITKEQNTSYLSGLLIGSEIRELMKADINQVVVCSGDNLFSPYKTAIEVLNTKKHVTFISSQLVEKITVNGQIAIYHLTENTHE